MKVAFLLIGSMIAGCSSGDDASGDACAQAQVICSGVRIQACTPVLECQAECLLDNRCVGGAPFAACVRARCDSLALDAGTGTDTALPSMDSGTRDTNEGAPRDTGTTSGGTDTSTSGGRGCSADGPNGCTCAPGVDDDGKGCSSSSLASPGVCCSNDARCRCQSVTCTSNSSGCSCIVSGLPSSSSTSCTGPLCCTFPASSSFGFGACACYAGGKPGGCAAIGGTAVSSCTPSKVPCYYKDEHTVSTCH